MPGFEHTFRFHHNRSVSDDKLVQLFAFFGENINDAFGLHVVFYRNGIPANGTIEGGGLLLKTVLHPFHHLCIGEALAAHQGVVNGFGEKFVRGRINVHAAAGVGVQAFHFARRFGCCWHNYRFC